jgi:uncharacterized protein YkwD
MRLLDWLRKLLGGPTWGPPPPPGGPPGPPPPPPDPTTEGAEVVRLINVARAGGTLLATNATLNKVAAAHSGVMAGRKILSHLDAGDGDPFARIAAAGYRYANAGETIGEGERTPGEIVDAWLQSPGHRAILLGDFRDVGAAVARAADGTPYWTACFGKPAG